MHCKNIIALTFCIPILSLVGCGKSNKIIDTSGLSHNAKMFNELKSNIKHTEVVCEDNLQKDCVVNLKNDKGAIISSGKLSFNNRNSSGKYFRLSQFHFDQTLLKNSIINFSEELKNDIFISANENLISNIVYENIENVDENTVNFKFTDSIMARDYIVQFLNKIDFFLNYDRKIERNNYVEKLKTAENLGIEDINNMMNIVFKKDFFSFMNFIKKYKLINLQIKRDTNSDITVSFDDKKKNDTCQLALLKEALDTGYRYKVDPKNSAFKYVKTNKNCSFSGILQN
ncbi:hypothetical protein [Fluviispira multicolorata]|uniref:Lipoprotein n=1 Tax=Fluviispira multicolorata TaxID=2654512 RepID=A0A833N2R7_9BACT|nr:hypothetical protein [Fluviispira multicolorata]KAB8033233.1 hypothetical protein GCL57_00625 [Fluviispira multicolorata]